MGPRVRGDDVCRTAHTHRAATDSNFKQPSLRAQAKQSIAPQGWIASRSLSSGARSLDPLARNDVETRARASRGAVRPSYASIPPLSEGAGNAGRALRPQPRMQNKTSIRA